MPFYLENLSLPYTAPQLSADEIYNKLLPELEEIIASNVLPMRWSTAESGRVSQAFAYMLYAEMEWYEKISFSYTGRLQNSIETKESKFLKSNLIKDWRNGMHHSVPVEANFMVMKYINVSPRLQLTDRMYTNKVIKSWDVQKQRELNDTVYGFYNIFDWNLGLSANTTVYGMWTPSRKLFGDKIQAIRHVMKPTISFSFAHRAESPWNLRRLLLLR